MSAMTLPVSPPLKPTRRDASAETTVGNYFVANYPPFGFWKPENVPAFHTALETPSQPGTPLGLYAHIPFCRKRCHFCYFRVYTDKNARDIRTYMDAMLRELEVYATKPVVGGRNLSFIYFGGGTPSYLSSEQWKTLAEGMKRTLPWDSAEEITLEGEPGTLNEHKLRAIRQMGVTRLSLGIEHFDDHVLAMNGRAHRSQEVYRAYHAAREVGFPQINIDLIAGMVEETEEKWQATVAEAIALQPDSVTIYQMEVPYNTTIYQKMKAKGTLVAPVADWETKRAWVNYAFDEFEKAGYSVATATTVVKDPRQPFLYRQGLFHGADILSVGVSSFGYVNGVNYQNQHDFQPYLTAIQSGNLPTYRAYVLSPEERYIREFALQLKGLRVNAEAFAQKFQRDPNEQFAAALATLDEWGFLAEKGAHIGFNRAGLLEADRLLFEFFRPEHRTGRFA